METDDRERLRRERDTARRVAQEALRHLSDDQMAAVRKTLDQEEAQHDDDGEPDVLRAGSPDDR